MPKRYKKSRVYSIVGGLIIYHLFPLGQQIWSLTNVCIFFGNQWKKANNAGCKKDKHPMHFWPFLRAPAEKKTDATFLNQF